MEEGHKIFLAKDYDRACPPIFLAEGMQLEDRSTNYGSANEKYKFTGKERDVETGYDYFGARYYDSRIGRFLTIDRFTDKFPSLTPYQYAVNNPVNFIDINGDSAQVITDKTEKKITFINDGKSKKKDKNGKITEDKAETKKWDVRTDVTKGRTEIEGDKEGKYSDDLVPKNIEKSEAYGPGDGTYIDTGREDQKDIHGGGTGLEKPYAEKQGWVKTHGCQRMQNAEIRELSKAIKDYKLSHPGEKVPGYIKIEKGK